MEKFDFTLNIKLNILFLKIVGLWPINNEDFYRIYTLIVTLFIMGLFNVTRIMNIFFVYTDLKVLTATIYLTVTDITVLIKTCIFIYNVKTLKRLTLTLNCDLFQPKSSHQKHLVQNGQKAWRISYLSFWSLVFCCLAMWTVSPMIQATPGSRILPLPAWYPFNTKITPFYEITYVCQVISMWFLATANMNMDSFIAALMMYIGAQCDILCDDLKTLQQFTITKKIKINFNEKLKEVISHHKKIIRFACDCNKSYNFIILAQFFTSSLAIALSMFQLTLVDPLSMESFPLLSYAFGMALQIFLYCWFGNEVEIKSFVMLTSLTYEYIIKSSAKSFANNCNKFYNGIVLGQFFCTSLALGLAMFLLSLVSPLSTESNTLLFYLGATTSEIFLYCWFGNEVYLKSSRISYSAFESDWTEVPIEAKKNLLIFILRAQTPIKMSAINLFSLSLATFTTILRTSWSYFAVLRQVNSQI